MQQKTALIVGMAKSGIAAARLLYEEGYRVIINDMKPEIKGLFDALSGMAYEVRLGDDPTSTSWTAWWWPPAARACTSPRSAAPWNAPA